MKIMTLNPRPFGAVCFLCAFFMMSGSVFAQSDFESTLKQYTGESVKGYIQPLQDMFGANLNSGFYHSAQIPTTGFHFGFEIIGMGSIVGDAQKTYTANAPPGFTPGATGFGPSRAQAAAASRTSRASVVRARAWRGENRSPQRSNP